MYFQKRCQITAKYAAGHGNRGRSIAWSSRQSNFGRGRPKSVRGSKTGRGYDQSESGGATIALFANIEHHCCREEQHDHFSGAYRNVKTLRQGLDTSTRRITFIDEPTLILFFSLKSGSNMEAEEENIAFLN